MKIFERMIFGDEKLAVDWDNVVVWSTIPTLKLSFRKCGKIYYPHTGWNFENYEENGDTDVIAEYMRLTQGKTMVPVKLCDERIPYYMNEGLKQGKLIVTTARPQHLHKGTLIEGRKLGVLVTDGTLFCTNKDGMFYKSKPEAMRAHNCTRLIDDGDHNVQAALDAGFKATLISHPETSWNLANAHKYECKKDLISVFKEYVK